MAGFGVRRGRLPGASTAGDWESVEDCDPRVEATRIRIAIQALRQPVPPPDQRLVGELDPAAAFAPRRGEHAPGDELLQHPLTRLALPREQLFDRAQLRLIG